MPGCRSCGGGGGVGGNIAIQKAIGGKGGGNEPGEPEMVMMEYTGLETQFQTLRSKVNGGRIYRFGGDPGHEERKFYAYAGDVQWMTDYPYFKVAKEERVGIVTEDVSKLATLTVDRPVAPAPEETPAPAVPDFTGIPVETLSIDGEIASILRKAGYELVEDVRSASVAELASIKGLGPARIKKLQHALA